MALHLRHFSVVLLLGGAALIPLRTRTPHDLDKLTTAQLNADLEAELDDIYKGHSPDEAVELPELKDEIMSALSDEGDDGLAGIISEEDLEAEMEEDNTTLEAVVDRSLSTIDHASAPRLNRSPFVFASFGPFPVRTTRRLAVQETKKEIIAEIQAVRR